MFDGGASRAENREDLIMLARTGASRDELVELTNFSAKYVDKHTKSVSHIISPEQREEIRTLRRAGLNCAAISGVTGFDLRVVWYACAGL